MLNTFETMSVLLTTPMNFMKDSRKSVAKTWIRDLSEFQDPNKQLHLGWINFQIVTISLQSLAYSSMRM